MSPKAKPSPAHRPSRRARPIGRQKADVSVDHPLAEADTFLPHERDESPGVRKDDGNPGTASRDLIRQAERDVSNGLQDTERRGIPSTLPPPDPKRRRSPAATGEEQAGGDTGGGADQDIGDGGNVDSLSGPVGRKRDE